MFGKRNRIVFLVSVFTLIVGSTIHAQTPETPSTYEETIKLFPDHLRNGFYGVYVVLTSVSNASEEKALATLRAYYYLNWMKENFITNGRGSELTGDDIWFAFYTKNRLELLAALGTVPMAAAMLGNPGGTDWEVWYYQLMEWL
jgi:hypothetical protein